MAGEKPFMPDQLKGQSAPDHAGEATAGERGDVEDELSPIEVQFPHREARGGGGGESAGAGTGPAEKRSEDAGEAVEVRPEGEAEFDSLLQEYLEKIHDYAAGDIIDATIVDVKRDYVLVDVGDKAEGVVNMEELVDAQGEIHVSVGDQIPVKILGRDNETGQVSVSYRRALGELAWHRVREASKRKTPVTGRVAQVVKSGLIVDVGVPAFMPASQIDTSRVEKLEEWVGREVAAYVIDLDMDRRRVVLSRRRLVEEDEERQRKRILESLEPGQERVVRIKKILDFGAFADLGGIDGLIPRDEVSWERGADPREFLKEGRDLKVKVLSVDHETGRVSLSRKQVKPDPWEKIEEKFPVDTVVKGKVVGVADFGAFVSLEEGIRGMIHSSDLSWAAGRKKVEDYLKVGDSVRAVVLEVDKGRRRMALGLKQITQDPWEEIEGTFRAGKVVKGPVTSVTAYGAFMRLTPDLEGLIHVSDMGWEKKIKSPGDYVKVGDEVEAVVLRIDRERRRINLGLKQLSKSPFERYLQEHREGAIVHGTVTRLTDFGAFVELAPEVEGLIHVSQLEDRRIEKPEEAVKAGQEIDAKILKVDKKNQKISLSRRAFLKEQEAREVEAYTSQFSSGGMKMGELLRDLKIQPADEE